LERICTVWPHSLACNISRRRGWTTFFGIITAVAGVMLMALPFSSIVTLATVVGICLVVLGVLEIISSYEIRLSEKGFIRIKAGTTDRS
jgi:uncharacterized membrane protein HdeD (DUF308 family)